MCHVLPDLSVQHPGDDVLEDSLSPPHKCRGPHEAGGRGVTEKREVVPLAREAELIQRTSHSPNVFGLILRKEVGDALQVLDYAKLLQSQILCCLLYTSDAADEEDSVYHACGGVYKKKKNTN
eukprot:TRINITY_DN37416_c0_g1_i1.p1 TRINITY_DN37416_c0_g1~~TRINITY_DN37416_c0_g1_i1.p1  ORF type:complete len:123 (-),score=15.57 TRINITY_DN37416_c0_g1_i1:7-375(-)